MTSFFFICRSIIIICIRLYIYLFPDLDGIKNKEKITKTKKTTCITLKHAWHGHKLTCMFLIYLIQNKLYKSWAQQMRLFYNCNLMIFCWFRRT